MTAYIETEVVPILVLAINAVIMFQIFPTRHSLRFSVTAILLFDVALYFGFFLLGALGVAAVGIRGIMVIPFLVWVFKAPVFQQLFFYTFQLLVTMLLGYLMSVVILIFAPEGSNMYYIAFLIVSIAVYAAYTWLMLGYGKRFFKKLFTQGCSSEWALYTLGITISFIFLHLSRLMSLAPQLYIPLFLFVFWSIGTLCYAIVNTHEKTKQQYDAEFAGSVISTGSGHYEKMNELYDTIRILRHDYKYHIKTVTELAGAGDIAELNQYLRVLQAQTPEYELRRYFSNPVINALLSHYAVGFGYVFTDCKPHACTARAGSAACYVALEYIGEPFRVYSRSRIGNRNDDIIILFIVFL